MDVRLLTKNATADDLTTEDYWDIYCEQRGYNAETGRYLLSIQEFIDLKIGDVVTKASWSKFHTTYQHIANKELDEKGREYKLFLGREMRNALRALVGRPLLPLTISDAAEMVDPNAEVSLIGDETAYRLILIGTKEPINLCVTPDTITASLVTAVTKPQRLRRKLIRPVVDQKQETLRKLGGANWREVINEGLKVILERKGIKYE